MAKAKDIEDQLRRAIQDSSLTRYQISKLSGVSQAQLCRFVLKPTDSRFRSLSMRTAAKVARVLGLELQPIRKEGK